MKLSRVRWTAGSLLLFVALGLSGCSGKWMGGLRRDFNDDASASRGPTVGGVWTERGLLSEDMEEEPLQERTERVGHSERAPASTGWNQSGSWVNEDQYQVARRDSRRAPLSMSESLDEPIRQKPYKNGKRATRADFVDENSNESSLWASDGQTNYFFTKNKVRSVGDILSVTIEAELLRDMGVEIARNLSEEDREVELELAQERLRQQSQGAGTDQLQTSAAAPGKVEGQGYNSQTSGSKKDEAEVRKATLADVDLSRALGVKAGDTVMAEIVERFQNGNYKIRGIKKVPYRNGTRTVSLVAIVRGPDISDEDVIPSGKLYEYRLDSTR